MPFTSRPTAKSVATARSNEPGKPAQPARHLRLWEAIRQTRHELEQWRQRVEQIDTLFRLHIQPREIRFTTACGDLTGKLMDLYDENSLTNARQALLALWIADNLRSLNTHPFASEVQCSALSQRWRSIQIEESTCAANPDSIPGKWESGSLSDALDDDELEEDDIVFDFGWHNSGTSGENTENDGMPSGDQPDPGQPGDAADSTEEEVCVAHDGTDQTDAPTADEPDSDATVSKFKQRLSIDRLFRQLARVLHPDREQDEALKAKKHDLMSQCLRARQDKDINTLLTLYGEHIGQLPHDLSATDHEDLINALQSQLRQLQQELRQQRFSDPLRTQIVERYSNGDEKQTLQDMMRHAHSLDAETEYLELLQQNLDSGDAIDATLDARQEIELDRLAINQMTGYS